MSHFYVDSSIIVSILFAESGHQKYRRLLGRAEDVFSSYLLEAEILSAVVREKLPIKLAFDILDSVSLVMPERSMTSEYRKIFAKGYCKGADAFHIATALYLEPEAKSLVFLTADKVQAKIAKSLGFQAVA